MVLSLLVTFFAGLLAPLCLTTLPPVWLLIVCVCLLPLLVLFRPYGRFAAAFLAGFVWAGAGHQLAINDRLAHELDGERVWIEARVADLPEATVTGWRFLLADAHLRDSDAPLPLIRAHWYGGEQVAAGEMWRFEATLRRPRGMSNPGGFDYEAWLYAQGIGALASIRSGERIRNEPEAGTDSFRGQVRERLVDALQPIPGGQRLIALVVGDKSVLTKADWTVLQATGTSHLMVISGLHVGMLAAAVFLLLGGLGRTGWIYVSWPRFWLAAPLGIVAAGVYAALAGFAVPTQRALMMVALVLFAKLLYRQPNPWTFWLVAIITVVMLAPAAPLRAGFWLSFCAVGLLIFGLSGRLATRGLWARWGRAQWVIFMGLWPWLLLWGMPGSLVAPLVNVLAIPWVSVLVVPAALTGTLVELLFDVPWFLWGAAYALNGLFQALTWAADWHPPVRLAFPGWISWLFGVVGITALLSPVGRLLGLPAMACVTALLFPVYQRPAEGQLWVTVLDVGQGLSVLLQTRQHALLYDAGARLSSGFDLGEAVVTPALISFGIKHLDTLLISHADNDHAGGAPAVHQALSVGKVMAGQHEEIDRRLGAEPCEEGDNWEWNGVRFEIVYSALAPLPSNERSCVLRVVAGDSGVMLSGDLGMDGEYQMLRHELGADLLLAPHHGSRTSSSYAFIRAVDPAWVVYSAGHNNRFNHPHPQVVARYRELQVEPVYTAASGALRFVLGDSPGGRLAWSWREHSRRFWHE
ncbi:MAG TPA: DNA internalization-related competence protein ComEC/Rec2 [Pseudomonas xinjiangensis]|uniref:DNA internalization-related competence protein ComEC/Rec2 n=2 Tax=root TaxID=1 RepID=A0A7V1FT27_9GAMM|nr:DNA internalization-related competence protein ComEC/Rec2 [Halopseudomonas xinjiangensis]HEC46767.1 DNA internalization-related competence protein ComEC/Rec2 [Halopseudomonas xinjiangensis]